MYIPTHRTFRRQTIDVSPGANARIPGWTLFAAYCVALVSLASAAHAQIVAAFDDEARPRLTWTGDCWQLETTTNFASRTNWSVLPVAAVAVSSNGPIRAALDLRTNLPDARYYRLRRVEQTALPAPGRVAFEIGAPTWSDVFVDPVNGNDENTGLTRTNALATIERAFLNLPEGFQDRAVRIRLMPGAHPGARVTNRNGAPEYPILIEPAQPGQATIRGAAGDGPGGLHFSLCNHVYLQNLMIEAATAEAVRFEDSTHCLVRSCRLVGAAGTNAGAIATTVGCQHQYFEDCQFNGRPTAALEVVATQWGHVVRSRIEISDGAAVVLRAGSANWLFDGDELTRGIRIGPGSDLGEMTLPWLHYEAYHVKVMNTLVRNTADTAFEVAGGYNVLFAHNTVMRDPGPEPALRFGLGARACDGTNDCATLAVAGAWGLAGPSTNLVPNRNVWVLNNLIFTANGGAGAGPLLNVTPPATVPTNSNVLSPSRADDNLVLRGNVFWTGSPSTPLGIESADSGCQEGSCTAEQIRSENFIETLEPRFAVLSSIGFRPLAGSDFAAQCGVTLPDFDNAGAPRRPVVPSGNLRNVVIRDFTGRGRPLNSVPGAWMP
jgi:hypothetical protein